MRHPIPHFLCVLIPLANLHPQPPIHLTFALPEIEGRISLVVFDKNDRPIRNLTTLANENTFAKALNGLETQWDGRDNSGRPAPPGEYSIRGLVVGSEVTTEGIAFHFNDWIDSWASPMFTAIDDFDISSNGDILVVGPTAPDNTAMVALVPLASAPSWQTPLPPETIPHRARIVAQRSFALAIQGYTATVLSAENGTTLNTQHLPHTPTALAATTTAAHPVAAGSALLALAQKTLLLSLPDLTPLHESPTPTTFSSLAISRSTTVATATDNPHIWIDSPPRWLPKAIPIFPSAVAIARDNMVWVAGQSQTNQTPLIASFNPHSPIRSPEPITPSPTPALRSLRTPLASLRSPSRIENLNAETPPPAAFAAPPRATLPIHHAYRPGNPVTQLRIPPSATSAFAFLEQSPALSRLAIIEHNPTTRAWEITTDRTITPCANFGIENNTLVPQTTAPQPDALRLRLVPNELLTTPPIISIQATSSREGTILLATSDAIPIAEICHPPHPARTLIARGEKAGQIRVFVGNGAVVAEYLVSGLTHMAQIDCGSVSLP